MSNTFGRIGTANAFDNGLRNLQSRQSAIIDLQGQISAQKGVQRGSDDPTAAAAAERATTRLSRIGTEQKALAAQTATIKSSESTLGKVTDAVQAFRDLVVSAGNGSYDAAARADLVQQLSSLRDQVLALANQTDSNGMSLFGGLGSTATPFVDGGASGVTYNGVRGQNASNGNAISTTIDGYAAFMDVPTGNGVFTIGLPKDATGKVTNTGTAWASGGTVTDPTALTGNSYSVTFAVDAAGNTTYSVPNSNPPIAGQPYTSGQPISFDGMSFTVSGKPANGDSMDIGPSKKTSIFSVMDQAISEIGKAGANVGAISQTVSQSLLQLDSGMARVSASRSYAGELLNRAERIGDTQDERSDQVTADLSLAEGSDLNSQVKRISEFQSQQTAYSAALASYAQIQKLSLFNYIS
ncbi:flagellar hook-associated protein FlgL [Xylophilus sp. ASV27]|uniref:flagellar hook-associated protein FlgL n=1 Tax=Xylophilus sp. ASV27 TaxID=2795129 RepID=UPI0018EBE5D5|nr:flagellar hook-associated protein FlgL [Xylophilus sp. ASV27]